MQILAGTAPAELRLSPPPARTALPRGASRFEVEVVTDVAEIDALAADWRALQALSGPSAVFQSHAHISVWARHFLSEAHGKARLHIAVVRRDNRAILILPLVISGFPVRVARLAGDPVAQYSEVPVDPAADLEAAFEAALSTVREAGAKAMVIRRVREDSHLHRLASPFARPTAARSAAPYADLTAFADYPAYLRSLSKKFRQGLRNRGHHIEKSGDVRFDLLRGGAEAREAVADAIDLKRTWLVQRGAVSSAFLDPATRECLLDLAARAETGSVVVRLMVDNEPAAVRFGFEYQGTHFAYMSAYDARFGKLSPGKMLMDFCISGFRERGLKRIDMLPPDGRHKADWCEAAVAVADYTLPLGQIGRAYAGLYQERLRPKLEWCWYHLPAGVRSLAATLLLGI